MFVLERTQLTHQFVHPMELALLQTLVLAKLDTQEQNVNSVFAMEHNLMIQQSAHLMELALLQTLVNVLLVTLEITVN
jgi:hypothetical protein